MSGANTTGAQDRRTSSPTLMELPPQPGKRTRSPGFTLVGTTLPSLFGAPGPTAMTVASGRGLDVEDEGRNMPDAVFCKCVRNEKRYKAKKRKTDCFCL